MCLKKKRTKKTKKKQNRRAEGLNRIGLDTALCTDPEHGSQWCVSDCFPFA